MAPSYKVTQQLDCLKDLFKSELLAVNTKLDLMNDTVGISIPQPSLTISSFLHPFAIPHQPPMSVAESLSISFSVSYLFSPEHWNMPLNKTDAQELKALANKHIISLAKSDVYADSLSTITDVLLLEAVSNTPSNEVLTHVIVKLWNHYIWLLNSKEVAARAVKSYRASKKIHPEWSLSVALNNALVWATSGPPKSRKVVKLWLLALSSQNFLAHTEGEAITYQTKTMLEKLACAPWRDQWVFFCFSFSVVVVKWSVGCLLVG